MESCQLVHVQSEGQSNCICLNLWFGFLAKSVAASVCVDNFFLIHALSFWILVVLCNAWAHTIQWSYLKMGPRKGVTVFWQIANLTVLHKCYKGKFVESTNTAAIFRFLRFLTMWPNNVLLGSFLNQNQFFYKSLCMFSFKLSQLSIFPKYV